MIVLFDFFSFFSGSGKPFDRPFKFHKKEKYVNGLDEYELKISEAIPLSKSNIFEKNSYRDGQTTQLNFVNLRPGSVVALRISSHDHSQSHFAKLEELVTSFRTESGTKYDEAKAIITKLNLNDLNRAIYQCDQEDRDMGKGLGTYNIPNFGSMVYCGTQGFVSLLTQISPNNDLGHPMCNNLRDGNWMIDYIHERLAKHPNTEALAKWIKENTIDLKAIPRYLVPCYFDVFITGVHQLLIEQTTNVMTT